MSSKYPDFLLELMDETLAEFPEVPTRTLAKRIYNENKKFFKDVEQVRSALRRRRGNSGKSSMKTDHKRKNGKAGWVPQLPPSQAVDWLPHEIKGPERIAVASDIHIPYHNIPAVERWLEDMYEYEPSIILLNGDILDFYRLSRFEKDPNKRDTGHEIDCVHDFLDVLQDRFEADIIWKDGNHDERWRKYLWNHAPEFAKLQKFQLDEILELGERNITYVTDQRFIMAGNLPILHGHEMQGGGGSINPARIMGSKLRNSAMQSHCHRSSEYLERNVFGDWLKCYSIGCLCELTPEYARVNRWNHGYAFVDVHEDGSFDIESVVHD
jgi:predicted phosphodiesterase